MPVELIFVSKKATDRQMEGSVDNESAKHHDNIL